jgi:hypothetical protein
MQPANQGDAKHAKQMDHPRAAEDRPHCLSVAHPPFHRQGCRVPLCADRARVAAAAETGATPYDIPGAEPFSHHGEQCSFDAFLDHYDLHRPALDHLAVIVRGADTARPELAPQAAGLLAISLGLSANFDDDQAMLEQGMVVYDALYTWCESLQGETHNWKPAA